MSTNKKLIDSKMDSVYKFDKNGNPIPYYGNTVISFLNSDKLEIFKMAKEVQKSFQGSSIADAAAFLPPESFHATVLTLCREIDRNTAYWPSYIPKDTSFHNIDIILKKRMEQVEPLSPVWMQVDICEWKRIVLKPADEQSRQNLSDYRNRLSEAVGIRHNNHETFRYHITLSYFVKLISEAQKAEADELCIKWTEYLQKHIQPFLLPKPVFTIFNNMMSYEEDLTKRGWLY